MKTMDKPGDLPLPFPTRLLKVEGGYVDEYIIPADKKEEVLKKLYPFVPVPSLDAVLLDIHEDKQFKAGDFRVLRGDDMDWLVSPYYPNSGGTVIDWVEPDEE
ncbi:MAG: hypothetical protein A2X34_09825 [Elusimicrobia bacterium GWC2_51_8]|nr:MAG: hypothetical protein A2X33_01920 [Elusimicrobia bacterium GWA2_51_34]OGR61448.1 MAG: hypothetical protein A2X34_09825 [Elusimicrobia bacterium GWC2_51_8]OGR85120.1 MAG: hypothetical protein A2021_09330 [Elusimicrobia bacterium GWF2_52_66]HAF94541.1 hypothetical protein [Elusimicrobiota bacterium]HCE97893.1 hypothetical protein [Elusimicrobiota bacterium]